VDFDPAVSLTDSDSYARKSATSDMDSEPKVCPFM
jgi:hypothetical protein